MASTAERTTRPQVASNADPLAITRVTKSCVLLEFGDEAVLTDPWFTERWFMHRGEPLGLRVSELPPLAAIIASHHFTDHWDMPAFAEYPHKDTTRVYVCGEKMAAEARDAGFTHVEHLLWGTSARISENLHLEAVPGFRMMGFQTNNYVINGHGLRVFFGGEARDLEPLSDYARSHAPVDVVLVPVNGLHPIGAKKMVMGPDEAIAAAQVLGAKTLVPIHDALGADPVWFFLRKAGSTEDTVALARVMSGAPHVQALDPGVRWLFEG